ncbi:hypothetical protein pb186bvf_003109 [Paramecium bursaria]
MTERDFLKQSANQFLAQPTHEQMNYQEQRIYQQSGFQYPSIEQTPRQLDQPKPNTLVDHFIRFTFVADPNAQQQYNQQIVMQQQKQQQEYQSQLKPSHMDMQLGQNFVPLSQNFLDYNANTKQYGQLDSHINYLKDPADTGSFQRTQMQYMQGLSDPIPPEYVRNLKQNIQNLGGIEDTVGNMQGSLNQYEIKHLVNKNIKNYPSPPPFLTEDQKKLLDQQKRQAEQYPHPFIYNPAEDLNRYSLVKQPYNPLGQTVQSNFFATQMLQQPIQSDIEQHGMKFDSIEQSKQLRLRKLQQLRQI